MRAHVGLPISLEMRSPTFCWQCGSDREPVRRAEVGVSSGRPAPSKRWLLALSLPLMAASRSRADDSVAFGHQTYAEEHGRIQVQTETLRVQKTITPAWI